MSDTLLMPNAIHENPPARSLANHSGNERNAPPYSWRGRLLVLIAVAGAFAAGWALATAGFHRQEKEKLPANTGAVPRDRTAVMVTIEPVKKRPVQRTVEGVGTLHAFEEITISARVEGQVRRLSFDVADRVKPGDSLLEIDPTNYELAVEQADRALQVELAKLGLAKLPDADFELEKIPSVMMAQSRQEKALLRHDRVRKLAALQAISTEESDNAVSDYRGAQADFANEVLVAKAGLATIRMKQTALAIAQQQLNDSRVQAPTPTLAVPGTNNVTYAITHRHVSEGTLVRPGTEICKMVINQTLKLQVPVPDRYSAEVKLGQQAQVHTAAFSDPFAGTVTRINPAVDPTTRTFQVEIQVPNMEGQLKPGSFAKAAILTRQDSEAVTVPLSALVNFAGINKIFLVKDGKAAEVQVTLGVQTTDWIEIAKPSLPTEAQVITSGQSVLATDTPIVVRSTTEQESTPAPPAGERGNS